MVVVSMHGGKGGGTGEGGSNGGGGLGREGRGDVAQRERRRGRWVVATLEATTWHMTAATRGSVAAEWQRRR